MSCAEARDRLEAALGDGLAAAERMALREHVAQGAGCAEFARGLESVAVGLRSSWPDREPPATLRECVLAAGMPAPGRRLGARAWARVGLWAAAVAVVALVVGRLGPPAPRPAPATTVRLELPAGTRLTRTPEVTVVRGATP